MINNLQSILTQNHLSTEAPVFCVYSKQEICVDGDFDHDKMIYIKNGDDSYTELSPEEYSELESAYNAATDYRNVSIDGEGKEIDYPMPQCPVDEESDFDPCDWEPRYIKLVDRFEQAFFIRENAQRFLDGQRHNLGGNAFIYVESAYRNSEWRQIRELLIAAAKKEENIFGELKMGLEYLDIVDGMWVVYSELPISNYANSLKRIWKTEKGWKEQTLAVHWESQYQEHNELWECDLAYIWDSKNYAPVDYDGKIPPVEFLNKVLPLTIQGEQD